MRYLKSVLCIVLICSLVYLPVMASYPQVSAGAAVAIDCGTGRVFYEKNAYTRMGMASTTKIMTAILALEMGNPEDIVVVDERAAGIEGSSLYLRAGDKLTLKNLVSGMMLRSGNDGAAAIALHFCDSIPAFAELMTQKAKDLGLNDTCFKNPHGLYEEGHYTTAYDLAQITRYGFTLQGFAEIVGLRKYEIDDNIETKEVYNNNKLLTMYDGADGVKTGYTPETGRTLVGSASREGMRVITVTLDDRDDWNDHIAMFNYCFDTFKSIKLSGKGQGFGCVPVKNGVDCEVAALATTDVLAVINPDTKITVEVITEEDLKAPVKMGDIIGNVVFKEGEKIVGKTELIAGCDVEKERKPKFLWKFFNWIMGK